MATKNTKNITIILIFISLNLVKKINNWIEKFIANRITMAKTQKLNILKLSVDYVSLLYQSVYQL